MPTLTLSPGVSEATFLAGIANEAYDRIELTAGSYSGFADCVINVDRVIRLAVKEQVPGTVTFDGSGSGGDGAFLFGFGGSASNIEFGPFTFDGYEVGSIGVIWVGNASDIDLSGTPTRKVIVQNCFSGGGAPDATYSWALYLSKDAGVGCSDITADYWDVTGSGRNLSGLQLQYAELHTNIQANHWIVEDLAFALYSNAHATGVEYDDWAIVDCGGGGLPSSVYFGSSFGTNLGTYSNFRLSLSDPIVNESDGGMVAGSVTVGLDPVIYVPTVGMFDPAIFDPLIFDTGFVEPVSPPTSPGTSPIVLYLDEVEVGAVQWEMQTEEVLGGVSRAQIIVQDRDNTGWEPTAHQDVKLVIRSSGWVLFRGETLTPSCTLPVGFPFRRWTIPCRDYNGQVAERLVGAPDGYQYWRPNDREPYRPIDPNAISSATDETTIQDWIAAYLQIGLVIDTVTHVHEYVPNGVLGSPEFIMWRYDAMTTLAAVIAELASLAEVNVQDWLDPDGNWHHVAIPNAVDLLDDGDEGDLDSAPIEIGPSGKGHMGLTFTWDGQTMPQQVYVQGVTPFVYDPAVSPFPTAGGSGWFPASGNTPSGQNPAARQAYLSVPSAWSRERAMAAADAALRRATQPTLRASFSVEGVDEWRAGQVVTINDVLLPPSMQGSHKFVIQRIATSLYAGTDTRQYQIDIGDGAVGRQFQGSGNGRQALLEAPAKLPAITWAVQWVDDDGHPDLSPIGADETRNALADTRNALGEPWGPVGMPIEFTVTARDADPDSPTYGDIVPLMGSFSPNPTVTDQDGLARSVFTAGSQEGLSYAAFAETELPQV